MCIRFDDDFLSAVNGNEEQYGQVQLLLHVNSVKKVLPVWQLHMQELLSVYGLLQKLRLSDTIQCASLHVSIRFNKSSCNIYIMLGAAHFITGQYVENCTRGL